MPTNFSGAKCTFSVVVVVVAAAAAAATDVVITFSG